jgi:hypothetical protein
MRPICRFRGILRIYIEILQQRCLREGWLVVDTRTSITVAAGSDFEVKRAINSENISTCKQSKGCKFLFLNYLSFSVPKMEARYSAIAG